MAWYYPTSETPAPSNQYFLTQATGLLILVTKSVTVCTSSVAGMASVLSTIYTFLISTK